MLYIINCYIWLTVVVFVVWKAKKNRNRAHTTLFVMSDIVLRPLARSLNTTFKDGKSTTFKVFNWDGNHNILYRF